MNEQLIAQLNQELANASALDVVAYFIHKFPGEVALASSLGIEDQVLTHMIASIDKQTKIFTLDTGRLFPETYSLISRTEMTLGIKLHVYFPDATRVEEMVNSKGINLFYDSLENRRLCCQVRKIEPLKRAFQGLKVWICGLRHEQSVTRKTDQLVEWDNANQLIKVNPLIRWTEEQVWEYIDKNAVPYNVLHKKGFPSIGCQPCTRAVKPGEDIRAGRWWWESPEHKECGLHKH